MKKNIIQKGNTEEVRCENGHLFTINEVVLPIEVRAQIVPCPYVEGWDGKQCGARIVWRNLMRYKLTE